MFYTDSDKLKKYTAENRLWQGIPGIEVTKKGRIFLTFFSGGIKEEIGNYVVLIKSDDGKSFSEPIAVAYEDGRRCYDPCLWIDPLNRLWFIWAYAPEHAVYGVVCDNPDADSLEWSKVKKIGNDVMINKPTVLKNGEWLFPIAVWANYVFAGGTCRSDASDRRAFVYMSNDNGKSFRKIGGADAKKRAYDEHMVLELKDDVLAMYMRTEYGIAVSYSYDRGRTWTQGIDSGLGGPCSRFHIRRLKSGRILMINHYQFVGRDHLTAMLSEDEGKTWKYKLLLDERADVSYPDAKEADDGYIYITYDRERGAFKNSMEEAFSDAREILIAKITEADIIAGGITDEGSKLKFVASKLGKYENENRNPYHEFKLCTESELIESVRDKNIDDIIGKLFDEYSVNCINMHKLDRKKMDELIGRLKSGDGDKTENICRLLRVIRSVSDEKKEDIPIVARVKDIIMRSMSENIGIDEIAEKMNMSKYYLCHVFKKETSMTLTGWKNYLRIERAKELLAGSSLKMIDIAHECGFGSASYFSEVFIKSESITPEAYRKRLKEAKSEKRAAKN